MRIIPDNADVICNSMMEPTYYHKTDTIEITGEEWDTIVDNYSVRSWKRIPFSQYLHQLIELARLK